MTKTLNYDLNGNLTSAVTATSTNTYEWDAADRLTKLTQLITGSPNLTSEFTYDGVGRRARIVEKTNGVTQSDQRFFWCGTQVCEERDSTGGTVTKRFFGQGEQILGTKYFFTRDHLSSVREMTDGAGTIRARYEYDSYGRRTKISGDLDSDFAFTGHYYHNASGLHLTLFRAYDANSGRWLNRDPLAAWPEIQLRSAQGDIYKSGPWEAFVGPNLYEYVYNSPLNYVDPDGLWGIGVTGGGSAEVGVIYGAAGTVSGGGGVFWGGPKGVKVGGYLSGGGFVGGPGWNKKFPKPCQTIPQPPVVGGAYAGAGWGPFFTNAKQASDLSGPFWQWNFNLGVGPMKASVNFAYSGGTGILSITGIPPSPGIGISGSGYPTTAITTP